MNCFFSEKNFQKRMTQLKLGIVMMFLFALQTQIEAILTPIPVPPGTTLTGNPLRVEEYINTLTVQRCSDLAHVIRELPINGEEFVDALDNMHPAPLQDLTFSTDENMHAAKQAMVGRNAYLRFDRCVKFPGLYSDHCNIGPSEMWVTPIGTFNNQAHIGELRGYRSSTAGLMLGVDSQPNKWTVLGFGLGYTYTDLHWKNGKGNADTHTGYFGVYGVSFFDFLYVDAAIIGSYEFYKTKRHIHYSKFLNRDNDVPCHPPQDCCPDDDYALCKDRRCHCRDEHCEIRRHPRDRYRGYAILSHVGFGGKFKFCGTTFSPFGNIGYDFVDQDGHSEHKAGSLNMKVKANHAHLLRTEFGLSITSCIPYNCAWFRPSLTVSYIRKQVMQGEKFNFSFSRYEDEGSASAYGTKRTMDFVAPGFGLEVQLSNQQIVSMNYDAELNRLRTTQKISIRFQRAY